MKILKKSRETRVYSDIDNNLEQHPLTHDVSLKINDFAIKQSLKNLILTRNYERPFHPEIGCQINGLLFEPFNDITANVIRRTVFSVVERFEPRVILTEVDVYMPDDDLNNLHVTIYYTIKNIEVPVTYTIIIKRNR